jgi:dTDP-4-amino-4,6-dideoxygalactose transaminase
MQIGNWKYDIIEAGYKCNMTDVLAAIGLIELKRYETDMLPKRKQIFDAYTNAFKHSTNLLFHYTKRERKQAHTMFIF